MTSIIRLSCLIISLVILAGCSYPDTKVTRSENRPALIVEGAPPTATLEVDGIDHGVAQKFNGAPKTLLVETGMHKIRILNGGDILMNKEIYLSDGETRSLTLKRE